jgi:DNA-binding NarL/FixJ family response regulator
VMTMVDFLLGRGVDEDRLAEALRLEDPQRRTTVEMRPTLIAGYLRLYEGRLDEGREQLSGLRTRILERGEETDLPFVSDELAWIEAWAGRLDVAASYVAESLAAARNVGSQSIQGLASSFAAFVYGWQGRAADTLAASAAADAAAAEAGWPVAALWGRWGRSVLALSTAAPKDAFDALVPLIDAVDAEGVSEPVRAGFVPEAVEALIGLGELERAERLLGRFEAAAVRLDRSWARLASARNRVQLLTARGDAAGAVQVADAALADPVLERFPFEQARILLAQGRAWRRSRHRGDADRALRAAAVLFERGGARAWATLAIEEARRTGFVRSGPELTPSEQRIASLVAQGMTNRAVADRLFISPKTVEATIARTYAKLGISSRAQLGAVMAARSSAARERRDDDTSGQTAAAD